jgi:hypothetical protein
VNTPLFSPTASVLDLRSNAAIDSATQEDVMPRSVFRFRWLALAGLVLSAACAGDEDSATGGEPVSLYDAYQAALLNPDGFDDYMRDNNLRTPEFHACVVAARNRLAAQWDQTLAACDTDASVTDKASCKDLEYNNVSGVLTGIAVAIRTDSTFAQTEGGRSTDMRREAVGRAQWEERTNGWLPVLRTLLVCEPAAQNTTAQ